MEETIYNLLNSCYTELSPITIKDYTASIKRIIQLQNSEYYDVPIKKNLENLLNISSVDDTIKNNFKTGKSQMNKYVAINAFLKCALSKFLFSKESKIKDAIKHYSEEMKNYQEEYKKDETYNKISQEDKEEKWINSKQHDEIFKNLKEKVKYSIKSTEDFNNLRNFIIFFFYGRLATRNDLADSKILIRNNYDSYKKLPKEHNYIIINKKEKKIYYIMNKYKTFKTFGQQIVNIPDIYQWIIKYYNYLKKLKIGNWFLYNDTLSDKMTRNRLGVVYSKLGQSINKKLSTRFNRKELWTKEIDKNKIKKLSTVMGHGINTILKHYAIEL